MRIDLSGEHAALGNQAPRWFRIILASIVGLSAAWLVFIASFGDVLAAEGMIKQAQDLPGNRERIAALVLPSRGTAPASRETLSLAHAALKSSAMSGEALVHLAVDAKARGEPIRFRRLLGLANLTGWHDHFAQRLAYNTALELGDVDSAARHADALLRQGEANKELFTSFNRGMKISRFRKALVPHFSGTAHWPDDYLVTNAGMLTDEVLLELLFARKRDGLTLDRRVAAPTIVTLLGNGRLEAAAKVWRMTEETALPGMLVWSSDGSLKIPTPFDWSAGEGYRIDLTDNTLIAESLAHGTRTHRLMALSPGRWRLRASDNTSGWQMAVECASRPTGGMFPLGSIREFRVDPDCPVQRLELAANSDLSGEIAPLAQLRLEKAD